jgi:P4 family phage/plasmid primase-like protien
MLNEKEIMLNEKENMIYEKSGGDLGAGGDNPYINGNDSLNSNFKIRNKNYTINVSREWTFNENIDMNSLSRIVDNIDKLSNKVGLAFNKQTCEKETWDGTKTIINNYYKGRLKSKPIHYKPNSKSKKGRHFSKECSLQGIPRTIRHTICRGLYKDYDMKNCHPTIFVKLCEAYGLSCDKIEYYIEKRDLCLKSFMEFTGWSKDDCKMSILKLMNGGNISELNYFGLEIPDSCKWILEFKDQCQLIHKNMVEHSDFFNHRKELINSKGKDVFNFNGKLVNKILCEFENILIQHAMHFCESNGIEIGANCFDGLLLRCCDKLNDDFLKKMQDYVVKNVGIPITFVEKEMDEFIDLTGFLNKNEKKLLEKEDKEIEKKEKKEIEKKEKKEKKDDRNRINLDEANERFLEKKRKKDEQEEKKRQQFESIKFLEKLSDSVLAEIFIQKTGDFLYRDLVQEKLYFYNHETFLYEPLHTIEYLIIYFNEFLQDYIDSVIPENDTEDDLKQKRVLDLLNARGLNNLLAVVKVKIPDSTDFIMENFNRKNIFPFQNKIVDFNLHYSDENFIRDRCKEDYCTFTTGNKYLYDDYDDKWIKEYGKQLLMTEDINYVNCLYTLLAHGLTNDNSIKLIIFFIGDGDNGKSALMNLIKMILQDFICTDASKAILKKGNSCLDTELVMLIGKRVATLSELRKEDNLDINLVKNISGDDKNIMLRPNANSVQISTIIDCKIMIPTNEMPTIPQKDSALLKRFGCFNFCNTFERSSTKLKEIMSMRNHVFTYLCRLASKLTLNNFQFNMCPQMLSYTSEIKGSIDTVKGFVSDMIDFTEVKGDYIITSDLYTMYKSYCEERGFTTNDILHIIPFGKKITKDYNLKNKKGAKKISKKVRDCYFFIKKRDGNGEIDDDDEEDISYDLDSSFDLHSRDEYESRGFTIGIPDM